MRHHSGISRSGGVARTVTRRGFLSLAVATPAVAILTPSTGMARRQPSRTPQHWTLRVDPSALRPVHPSQLPGDITLRGMEGDTLVSTGPITTDHFSYVAVSSPSPIASARLPHVLLRTRTASSWSQWSALHADSHGPDGGTAEARNSRAATQLQAVEESDALELALASTVDMPLDLSVHLIQPAVGSLSLREPATEATDPTKPTILTRADWEADETIREPGDPLYGQIRGAFVHHTADPNSYSANDVPGIIQSIYVYHVETNKWRDIGYNFIIDRFGRIWEGRYGGIDEPVVGAHTRGYNSSSFGVAVIGNYMSKTPESTVLRAYQRLIAWKFSLHEVKPLSIVGYPSQQPLPAISGHRDAGATLCPGDQLYDAIPALRREVHFALRSSRTRTLVSPIGPKPVIPPAD